MAVVETIAAIARKSKIRGEAGIKGRSSIYPWQGSNPAWRDMPQHPITSSAHKSHLHSGFVPIPNRLRSILDELHSGVRRSRGCLLHGNKCFSWRRDSVGAQKIASELPGKRWRRRCSTSTSHAASRSEMRVSCGFNASTQEREHTGCVL